MFTGIIQAIVPIIRIEKKESFHTHYICLPTHLMQDLITGASVAHNGCCLTVTSINDNIVSFDIIKETLKITNLEKLKIGDKINLERAASLQKEIGGHLMSGHIICTAKLKEIITSKNSQKIWLSLSDKLLMKYILNKGYIGVDGISLTVGEIADDFFCINLIPETLLRTTIGKKQVGDVVNIEIDSQTQVIVDTIERILGKPS